MKAGIFLAHQAGTQIRFEICPHWNGKCACADNGFDPLITHVHLEYPRVQQGALNADGTQMTGQQWALQCAREACILVAANQSTGPVPIPALQGVTN